MKHLKYANYKNKNIETKRLKNMQKTAIKDGGNVMVTKTKICHRRVP